jgi:hypothetical protein
VNPPPPALIPTRKVGSRCSKTLSPVEKDLLVFVLFDKCWYHTDHTNDTFIVLSTYRRFLFLRTILAVSVDVSTTKFIFESYFSWPISLENLRNLLIRFRRFIFYSVTISYILQPTYRITRSLTDTQPCGSQESPSLRTHGFLNSFLIPT